MSPPKHTPLKWDFFCACAVCTAMRMLFLFGGER